jgi:hypothetical protein
MALPPTEDSLSQLADIAKADGKATGSNDVGGKVALLRCHEDRPLPKRLDFGKPRHELRGNVPFSDIRRAEELHQLADQVRVLAVEHNISGPRQPILKVIESRLNSIHNLAEKLRAVGLKKTFALVFGKVSFVTVLVHNVSVAVDVNGSGRSFEPPVRSKILLECFSHTRSRSASGNESAQVPKHEARLRVIFDSTPELAKTFKPSEEQQNLEALSLLFICDADNILEVHVSCYLNLRLQWIVRVNF